MQPIWYSIAAAVKDPTIHDVTEHTPASVFFWAIIVGMGGIIVWFIVRDRNSIANQLEKMNIKLDQFMTHFAEHYASKEEVMKIEKKLDRHLEQSTLRQLERRAVEDAEG